MTARAADGRRPGGPSRGFSLIELMVVVLLIGILVAFGVPSYLKSVETTKADQAASLITMVGTTNRMFHMDHGATTTSYATGRFTNAVCGTATCPAAGTFTACHLVACKYLASQDWDAKDYNIFACDGAGTCGTGSTGCGSTAVACARRKSGSAYSAWGYYVDDKGIISTIGSAPSPVN